MSFENALVTKGLMVGSAVSSILVGLFDFKHYFHLQLVPHVSSHHQYWRLLVHHLAFSNSTDLFLAEILLFNVGVLVERQFGSAKYASFAAITILLGTIVEFVSLILFHRFGLNHIAMGPSVLIFGIVYQYSRIVPAAYSFRIFGVPLSNKNVPYLLALQLAASRLPGSAAVAIIGILTGQLYRSDLANFRSYRLPSFVIEFATRFILPLLGSARPPHRSNRAIPDERLTSHGTSDIRPPNDEVITTARTPPASTARTRFDLGHSDGSRGASVVRQWVDELSGRVERESAVRIATEEQISTMTTMFPHVPREIIINALQENRTPEEIADSLLAARE
jgi:membrane associated rhomboid family serine protease